PFDFDPLTKLPTYGFQLESVPSTGLVADENALYVCFSERVIRYAVPNFRVAFKAIERPLKAGTNYELPQLVREGIYNTLSGVLLNTPILRGQKLVLPGANGNVFDIDKLDMATAFKFVTGGEIPGGTANSKSFLFAGSTDYFLYAIDMNRGTLVWRFAAE